MEEWNKDSRVVLGVLSEALTNDEHTTINSPRSKRTRKLTPLSTSTVSLAPRGAPVTAAAAITSDVRVIQAGNGPCLALESLAQFGSIGKVIGKDFNGNDAV
jgi:hypothetical protein